MFGRNPTLASKRISLCTVLWPKAIKFVSQLILYILVQHVLNILYTNHKLQITVIHERVCLFQDAYMLENESHIFQSQHLPPPRFNNAGYSKKKLPSSS